MHCERQYKVLQHHFFVKEIMTKRIIIGKVEI